MKAILKACALAAITLACSIPAQAAGDFYIGGAIGRGAHNLDDNDFSDADDSDTGYKLFAGYRINKWLAVEAAYFDFGEASGRVGLFRQNFESSAYGVNAAFTFEFAPKWIGIGRIGLASVETEYTARTAIGGIRVDHRSENNAKIYGGLGVGYSITPQLNVQATWDFTQAEVDDNKGRVDLLGVGVTFSF